MPSTGSGLAILLLFLTADEGAQFHELLTRPMREVIDRTSGAFRSAWVIPGALPAMVVGLLYLRFLFKLPGTIARRFVIAAVMFLSGSIGMEMIGGWYLSNGENDFGYNLLLAVEELLEMSGVIVAIDAAFAYLAMHTPAVRLTLMRQGSPPASV